ncbi:MAG: slipin family protein [Lachnospiraceae bacterium]|nr:slipin family protein [Lachnospiraceae bacterium]
MKVIIKENEVGFVTKNGIFDRLITAGKYYFSKTLGYQVHIEEMLGELNFMDIPYQILEKDQMFMESTVRYEIPDGFLGLIYVNNTLRAFAVRKEYIFWNVFEKYEVKLISMEQPEIGEEVTKQMLAMIPTKYYTTVLVGEGEIGLLYYNHTLQKKLASGAYYFWNDRYSITARIIDMKQTELNIVGQEILTKDKIGIRMNVTCTYKIRDAVALSENIKNLEQQMYSFAQLVIRELTGNYKLDEILELKEQISKEVFLKLKENENTFYVEFLSAGIKDIILPGEIKDIMNSVLVAEKAAQANVISRREEVASTRSLLNTAKLMDENKTLYRLKELEYLEKICDRVGEISVNGNAGLIEQLGQFIGNH